ncbi:hypothetical protein Tsubulata_009575 [Turnera subulata]|uniref:RRM domain-containing protein n=1 Tax=Turnera subulata TaxID=218843 RepID=A0A9Q0GJG9_9ROSI|nr:hypothetical protein Tsubulata_009575 [Turnera subulata]
MVPKSKRQDTKESTIDLQRRFNTTQSRVLEQRKKEGGKRGPKERHISRAQGQSRTKCSEVSSADRQQGHLDSAAICLWTRRALVSNASRVSNQRYHKGQPSQSLSTLHRPALLPPPPSNLKTTAAATPFPSSSKNNPALNPSKETLPRPSTTQPKPQQFSRWSWKQIQNIINNQKVTNLYIGNLPLQWIVVELHVILSKYGEVIDVYIPSKRAKNGKRFGLVRYRACTDINQLISSINLIQVGNGSLQASPARERPHPHQTPHKSTKFSVPPTLSHQTPYKSFVDITKDRTPSSPKHPNTVPDKASISFSTLPCETDWLSKCALGVLSEPLDRHLVLQIFLEHGHSVIISDFGGDSILFQFLSAFEMSRFIESNHDCATSIFDLLRPWQKTDGPSNRKVWIRAKGIPLHAWSSGFFHSLVSRFGSLIQIALVTEIKSRLDYAFLQVISTVFKPISWEISALIDDSTFQIFIDEISFPPSSPPPLISNNSIHDLPLVKPLPSPNSGQQNPSSVPSPAAPPPGQSSGHGGGAASPSGQKNSDPFNLMPSIENTDQPTKWLACPNIFTSQNKFSAFSCNDTLSRTPSVSNLAAGPTNAATQFPSLCKSSTDSSTPNSLSQCSASPNSSFGLSSPLPVVSFNNSDPPPSLSKPIHPPIIRTQSLPNLYLLGLSCSLKPSTLPGPLSPVTHSPPTAQELPTHILNSITSSPNSPSSLSSLDNSLTPHTHSNIILQNLEFAMKSKRITTRKKAPKAKPTCLASPFPTSNTHPETSACLASPSPTCNPPLETAPNSSSVKISETATNSPSHETPPCPSSSSQPISFCSIEADCTIQIENSLGWDCSSNPEGTRNATVALIEKEGFDWCKSYTI